MIRSALPVLFAILAVALWPQNASADTVYAQSAFGDPVSQAEGGAAGLMAVEADIEGGIIPVGSTAQVIVRFKNEGNRPVEFRDVNLYPSSTISAQTTVNQCATEPLESGAECAIVLSVKGLQPGNWRVELLVRHTGQSRLVTARITGLVEANADAASQITDVEVIPAPVDFGTLEASRPIIRSATIRNITANPIEVDEMFIDAPPQSGFDLRTDCGTLAPGQACIASILWSPIIEGPSSGFLVIRHDGASGVTNIPLTGSFDPGAAEQADVFPDALPGRGVLVSSETEIDFGTDINAQSAITVSLVNVGDSVLEMRDIRLAGSDNGLKLLQNGCQAGLLLDPTEACPLTVSWAPTKEGAVIDDVQIVHSGARGILVLPVRGTASGAISVDSRPIVITRDNFGTSTSGGTAPVAQGERVAAQAVPVSSATPPNLDGYIVTSHSARHAIIRGPVGSRIVSDGKTTMIGGYEWMVTITDNGVRLESGNNTVLLVFDRSLSNMTMNDGSVPSSSSSTTNRTTAQAE